MIGALIAGIIIALLIGLGIGFVFRNAQLKSAQADSQSLIEHAENVYQSEAIAQNSKIKFGTDDNEHWFAHDVPFYGTVQIDRIEEHGLVEWDIHFNGCWQGPFNSKSECIKHLEECIKEEREQNA